MGRKFEDAAFALVEPLYDASDHTSSFGLAVHIEKGNSVVSLWQRQDGVWLPFDLEPNILNGFPNKLMMHGIIFKAASNQKIGSILTGDMRYSQGMMGLSNSIDYLIGPL